MDLVIDIGNTLAKVAAAEGDKISGLCTSERLGIAELQEIEARHAFRRAILCSVRERDEELCRYLRGKYRRFVDFTGTTPTPLENLYKTPETLGPDRLAAAVGAQALFPGRNVLVVDLGSAITIDLVSAAGEFLGGNISPGAALRFRSLNRFTAQLPLYNFSEEISLLGKETSEAIRNGVVNGIRFEVEKYISLFGEKYDDLITVFTGGDAIYFEKQFKNAIFVRCELTLIGLTKVLDYNDQ